MIVVLGRATFREILTCLLNLLKLSREQPMVQASFHAWPGMSATVLCFASSPMPCATEKSQERALRP